MKKPRRQSPKSEKPVVAGSENLISPPREETAAGPAPKPRKKRTGLIVSLSAAGGLLVVGAIVLTLCLTVWKPQNNRVDNIQFADVSGDPVLPVLDLNGKKVTLPEAEASFSIVKWNGAPLDATSTAAICATYIDKSCPSFINVASLTGGWTLVRSDDCWFVVGDGIKVISTPMGCGSNAETLTAHIADAMPAKTISAQGQTFTNIYYSDSTFSDYAFSAFTTGDYTADKIADVSGNALYRVSSMLNKDDWAGKNLLMQRIYVVAMPDQSAYQYILDSSNIRNDDGSLKVKWNDSGNAAATFQVPTRGCGIGSSSTAVLGFTPAAADLQRAGTINGTNAPLYKLTRDDIMRLLYGEYKTGRGDNVVSYSQFLNAMSIVVYQDGFGEWNLLQNAAYGPSAECAKPVIYLYPTTVTSVDVAVGANVRLSEPFYPERTGWQNVTAWPNGRLVYSGQTYDSLFWEGKGRGEYPDVSRVGTVVKQQDLLAVLRQQLAAQGLNAQEAADFIAFWSDKLPQTPYVKLTWLSKAQIDRLAPLTISPQPTTTIRVFLDAEGLDSPETLTPQHFTAPERRGFTVVEWGGLMH